MKTFFRAARLRLLDLASNIGPLTTPNRERTSALFNKTFSGYQPRQVVQRRASGRFENHRCPRHQETASVSQFPDDDDG